MGGDGRENIFNGKSDTSFKIATNTAGRKVEETGIVQESATKTSETIYTDQPQH